MENIPQGSLTPEDYKILKLILKKNPGITNPEVIEVFEKYKQDVANGAVPEEEGIEALVKVLKVLGILALIAIGVVILGFVLANIWWIVGVLLAIFLLGMVIKVWFF